MYNCFRWILRIGISKNERGVCSEIKIRYNMSLTTNERISGTISSLSEEERDLVKERENKLLSNIIQNGEETTTELQEIK